MDKPKRPGRRASHGEWERYHDAMAFWKSQQPVNPITRGIAAVGIIGTIGTAVDQPQQADTNTQKNWGDTHLRDDARRRSAQMDEETRDSGYRAGRSSQ